MDSFICCDLDNTNKIKNVGVDILHIQRIAKLLSTFERRFVERILTAEEREKFALSACKINFLAKKFAAKEAISKALGFGIGKYISWQDITIMHNKHGRPQCFVSRNLYQKLGKISSLHISLSLSDEKQYVIAFCNITIHK